MRGRGCCLGQCETSYSPDALLQRAQGTEEALVRAMDDLHKLKSVLPTLLLIAATTTVISITTTTISDIITKIQILH